MVVRTVLILDRDAKKDVREGPGNVPVVLGVARHRAPAGRPAFRIDAEPVCLAQHGQIGGQAIGAGAGEIAEQRRSV